MRLDTLKALDNMFLSAPMMRADGVPTDVEIEDASNRLGIAFPNDYVEFLRRFGGAMVGPYPVFGLRPVDVMEDERWSVVEITEATRASLNDARGWVVFSEDHGGNPIGFDSSGSVVVYDHDFGGISKVAEDFESYLRHQCLKIAV
jgi:hypothetical protein